MSVNTRLLYKLTNILKSFCLCYSLKKVVFSTKDLKCIEKLIRSDVKVEENYAKTFK